ncbi:glycoside hydrolase family 57 protein [Treponema putidum]|uniref:glycoside hydrolase family 57 protein n=1 Tax=Treponema putidum TaxID=221027 RepID=UPI003D8C83EE
MKDYNLLFILDAHLPYVRNESEQGLVEEDWLFNALSYLYLPILKMCSNLMRENVPFKIGAVFEPTLCDMLADKVLQDRYRLNIQSKIEFAKKELERFAECAETKKLIQYNLKHFSDNKRIFEDCGGNVLKQFDYLARKGYVELLATTATNTFLPFFLNMPEAIAAQIEMGQINYRKHFSTVSSGFWLPSMAYFEGLDDIIRSYGYDYTVVSSKAFLLSDKIPPAGVFSAASSKNGLKFLACDLCACGYIYDETDSIPQNKIYIDVENDVGFKLSEEYLASVFDASKGRRAIGFRYWSKEEDVPYDIHKAHAQIYSDAEAYVNSRVESLRAVKETKVCESPFSLLTISSDFFGKKWCEGIIWLEHIFRLINDNSEVKSILPSTAANLSKQLYTVRPFFSSFLQSGYADELLTKKNDWMYRYIVKITERMIELVEMFPADGSLKERVLNAAAREVLLLQSMYWPLYANNPQLKDFAERRFVEHVNSFTAAYEALGADSPDAKWLSERENKYPLFKDINYRIFSRKK